MKRAFLACVMAMAGCADSGASTVEGTMLPNTSSDAGPNPMDAGCAEGPQLSCTCSNGTTGTRSCVGTSYAACEGCAASQVAQQSKCVAGTYSGKLTGTYHSEPAGLCGLVAGPEEQTNAKWSFDLVSEGNGEFFSVRAGCVHFADNSLKEGGTNYGQSAKLTGSVDCKTGELKAELRGTYVSVGFCDLGQVWTQYFFKGALQGRFDPASNGFAGGMYDIKERTPLLGEPAGGSGTWTATLDPEAPIPDPGEDCFNGVQFSEELTPKPYLGGMP